MVSSLHPPNSPDPNCSCGPPPKKLAAEHPLKPPYLVKKIVSTKFAQYWHLWLGNEVVYVTSGFLKRV